MPQPVLHELSALLSSRNPAERERAWREFVTGQSRLLLHVARALGGDHDAAMDRYAFMLEALERDDFRRLRSYVADSRCSFSTWLIVVARRLCLDHHRQRYGRSQAGTEEASARKRERRQLTDLLGDELALATLESSDDGAPDLILQRNELLAALREAVAGLDCEDRLLLRLRFEEDISVPAIARLWNEPSPFKLYRRIDKLLADLRGRLERAGVQDEVP
jgi:RNA polymerase sigma factor (sigma-70 family)